MQVGQLPASRRPAQNGALPATLLPELFQLLQPSLAARVRRDQLVEQSNRREQRHDDSNAQALAALPPAERPSDVLRAAEKDLRSGSSARREQAREQSANRTPSERGFRQVLAGASTPRTAAAALTADRSTPPTPATLPTAPVAARPALGSANAPTPRAAPAAPAAAGLASVTSPAVPNLQPVSNAAAPVGQGGSGGGKQGPLQALTPTMAVRSTTAGGPASRADTEALPSVSATASIRAARTASRATPAEEPGSSDANIERIVRLLASRISKERSVATLRLDPPELGTVRLHLDLRQDQLVLQVDTQSPAAQRLLEEQLDTLRRSLEAAGVHLERVEIRAPHPAPGTPDSGVPSQEHPPTDGHPGASHQDAPAAGGNAPRDTEVPSGPADSAPELAQIPAAESLVNILA